MLIVGDAFSAAATEPMNPAVTKVMPAQQAIERPIGLLIVRLLGMTVRDAAPASVLRRVVSLAPQSMIK